MTIDHLICGAPDLDTAVDALERRLGVRAAAGGQHTGVGTRNALLALGGRTYLELIGPDPDQPPPVVARPFGVDDLTAPRLVGWAVACDDIDAAIARSRARGYDPGDAVEMARVTPRGTTLRWRLTLNARGGGPVPFLIAWGDTEHPARAAPRGLHLEGLEIEHPQPASLERTLRALDVEQTVVRAAPQFALVARISGPHGTEVLR